MEQGIGKRVLGVLAGAVTVFLFYHFLYFLPLGLDLLWSFIGVMICLEILSITSHKQGALYGAFVMDTHAVFLQLLLLIECRPSKSYCDPGPLGPFWIIYALIVFGVIGAILGLIGVTLLNAIRKR